MHYLLSETFAIIDKCTNTRILAIINKCLLNLNFALLHGLQPLIIVIFSLHLGACTHPGPIVNHSHVQWHCLGHVANLGYCLKVHLSIYKVEPQGNWELCPSHGPSFPWPLNVANISKGGSQIYPHGSFKVLSLTS